MQYIQKVYFRQDLLVSVLQSAIGSVETVLWKQQRATINLNSQTRGRVSTLYGDSIATSCISSVTNLTLPKGNPLIPKTQLGLCGFTGLRMLPTFSGYRPNILVVEIFATTSFLLSVCTNAIPVSSAVTNAPCRNPRKSTCKIAVPLICPSRRDVESCSTVREGVWECG
jgi:hypothetical protein